jgi:hypothetical protein
MASKMGRGTEIKALRTAETDDDGAPLLATSSAFDSSVPVGQARKRNTGHGHAGRMTSKKKGGINLKTVAQACIDEGLDPAVEIARVLATKVPVLDRKGKQKLDENGKPMTVDLIDPDTKLRTLTQLLEYNQPKLKSIEHNVSGTVDLTAEQLDQRIAALLAKAVTK